MLKVCNRCNRKLPSRHFQSGEREMKQCSSCREKGRNRFQKHYANNSKRVLERISAYRNANPEAYKALKSKANRGYRKRNPDAVRKSNARYNKRNKGRVLALNRERSVRLMKAFLQKHRKEVQEIYARAARLRAEGQNVHVHHIVPLKGTNRNGEHVACGLHVPWNLQIVPAEYNLKKHAWWDPERSDEHPT